MDNPEKLAILVTQDTRHKTQDEVKQNILHRTLKAIHTEDKKERKKTQY